MGPHLFVFVHLHKIMICEDIACVIVDDGANEVNGGVRGWRDSFQEVWCTHGWAKILRH
jgi:hypothetical protein